MADLYIATVKKIEPDLLMALNNLIPQLTKAPIPTLEEIQNMIDSGSLLFVVRIGSIVRPIVAMGSLGIFHTPSGVHAHIEDVVVDEKFRGQGIGESLVRTMLNVASEMNFEGVSLTCNPARVAANRLYRKMGFTRWDTNVYWYKL